MADREDRDVERRGGYVEAQRMPAVRGLVTSYVYAGIVGGLVAGLIFAVMEMIFAAAMGMSALMPIRMFASILLGQTALSPATSLSLVLPVAIIAHFAIAAFWGAIFGLIAGSIRGFGSIGAFALAGVVFGTLVWLIDFYVLAPLFWSWFIETNALGQFILHALFYGLPLGLWLGYATRPGPEAGLQR